MKKRHAEELRQVNERLQQEIVERQQAEKAQNVLLKTSQAVATSANLQDLLAFIHQQLGQLIDTKNFYVALYDDVSDLYTFPYWADEVDSDEKMWLPQPMPKSYTDYVRRSGKPILADWELHDQLVASGEIELVSASSEQWLGAPLRTPNDVIGVVAVQSYTDPDLYTAQDLELIAFASDTIAMAIERKAAEDQLTEYRDHLEQLVATRTAELAKTIIPLNLWKNPNERKTIMNLVKDTGEFEKMAFQFKRKDGSLLIGQLSGKAIEIQGEQYVITSVRDITEQNRAEAEREALIEEIKRSNQELQNFAYIASHDLQEPLRKITVFGNRLQDKYGQHLDKRGRDYLARMQEAAMRGQTLIKDLLAFSRVSTQRQPFTEVDLTAVIKIVLYDLEDQVERTRAQIKVDSLPHIEADETQMRQLFQNLISNALKFQQNDELPRVEIRSAPEQDEADEFCQITVSDNGIGFDEDYLDQIFTIFQRLHTRREYEGTGIGLAICRRIVERHNGRITARSQPGVGSTFIVTLSFRQTIVIE